MKVLEVIPGLTTGGAERFVIDLSNEMSRNNNLVHILTFNLQEETFLKKLIDTEVQIKIIDKRGRVDFQLFGRIYNFIKKVNPDIIHTHVNAFNYLWIFKLLFPKIKFVHTVHNNADKEFKGKIEYIIRKLFLKPRYLIPVTISPTSRDSFTQFYGFEAPLITNGRPEVKPTSKYSDVKKEMESHQQNGYSVLVNIGRIVKQKNQLMLVNAVNDLNSKGHKIVLYIIGAKRKRGTQEYEDIIANLTNNIKLAGERSNPEDYLLNADGFCLSSAWEGMPITFIEALSAHCIPICTPVGGLIDYIEDGVNGFISEDTGQQSYTNALKRFLKSIEKEKIKIEANKTYQKYFSIHGCTKNYLELFKS